MKFKRSLQVVFAAATMFAGAACATSVPNEAPKTAIEANLGDIEHSLTGYLNTTGIKASDIKDGFTLPWATSKTVLNFTDGANISGYIVATGKVAENGCPEFKVFRVTDGGNRFTSRAQTQTLPVCPKP